MAARPDVAGLDVAVIGGGIVGLALADAVLARDPTARVTVFEKEDRLAVHASGSNSGVLHAGFYYHPDSAKARLTRRGNQMLHSFCAEHDVDVRETGKVVVATDASQVETLRELHARGLANGVPVELVDEDGLRELEPLARTHGLALWSPSTAVADPKTVVTALAERVRARGGVLELGLPVTSAGPGWVETRAGRIPVGHVVNAAGLQADRVAHWFEVGREYRVLPFKGLYWYGDLAGVALTRHVYPVPDLRNPFLGVHLTVTVDGRVKVGPTAIPALWRESYGGRGGFDAGEVWEVARTLPRFLAGQGHRAPHLLASELPKLSRRYVLRQAAALVPSVGRGSFRVKGRPGIRAQLLNLETNQLEMDFAVRSGPRSTHLLNAVSPGWTTSLAMAEEIAPRIEWA